MFTLHIMASISVQKDSKGGFALQWIPIINTQACDTYNKWLYWRLESLIEGSGLQSAWDRFLHVFLPTFQISLSTVPSNKYNKHKYI